MQNRFANQKVLVLGAGKSGVAAATLLVHHGAAVTLADAKRSEQITLTSEALASAIRVVGSYDDAESEALYSEHDLVVISPGLPAGATLARCEARGLRVISEIELAAELIRGKLVAITGTNGKSTVTTLVGEMLSQGYPTFVGGNLGEPATHNPDHESQTHADARAVWEVSSFQLERCFAFHAHVGVLLNITEDHLDRHGTLAEYGRVKAKVFLNQKREDAAIAYSKDAFCVSLAKASGGTYASFGTESTDAAYVAEDQLLVPDFSLRFSWREFSLSGAHNRINAAAAALSAFHAGAKVSHVEKALREFNGLPHRMRLVATRDGVRFFNDSKATNVGAAVASLEGLKHERGRVVLIAGGVDKGGSYRPLCEALLSKNAAQLSLGHTVVLFGASAALIDEACRETGIATEHANSLEQAVEIAAGIANPGDAVVLAPACASFDMFRSYAHRGEVFENTVRSILAEPKGNA